MKLHSMMLAPMIKLSSPHVRRETSVTLAICCWLLFGAPWMSRCLSQTSPPIGISAVPANYANDLGAWYDIFEQAETLGAEIVQLPSEFWRECEGAGGRFPWSDDTGWYRAMVEFGFNFRVSKDFPGPFFHDEIVAPANISFTKFTQSTFLNRYLRMVDAYLDSHAGITDYILIHAEGSYSYFDAHPEQLIDFSRFLRRVRARIRARAPHIKVGVNIDPTNNDVVLRTVAAELDLVSFDIVRDGTWVNRPTDLALLINRLLNVIPNKKIAIAFYWSTSVDLGGTLTSQSQAFESAMQIIQQHQDRFEYAVFGCIYDDNPVSLFQIFRERFLHYPEYFLVLMAVDQASQGVIREDGSAKPAWTTLRQKFAEFQSR